MKKLFVLLALISFFSCKKSTTNNSSSSNNNNNNTTAATYTTQTIQIALVDETFGTYSVTTFSGNCKAIVHCNNVAIDSLVSLDTTQTSNHMFNPCSSLMNINQKTFKIQNGADNYLDIYMNGVQLSSSLIWVTHTPPYLEALAASSSQGTLNQSALCSNEFLEVLTR